MHRNICVAYSNNKKHYDANVQHMLHRMRIMCAQILARPCGVAVLYSQFSRLHRLAASVCSGARLDLLLALSEVGLHDALTGQTVARVLCCIFPPNNSLAPPQVYTLICMRNAN